MEDLSKIELIKFCSEHSDYELCKYAVEHKYHIYVAHCGDANKTLDIVKEVCNNSNGKYEFIEGWLTSDSPRGAYDGAKAYVKMEEGEVYCYHIWYAISLQTFTHRLGWAMETPVVILNIDRFIDSVIANFTCQYLAAYSINSQTKE